MQGKGGQSGHQRLSSLIFSIQLKAVCHLQGPQELAWVWVGSRFTLWCVSHASHHKILLILPFKYFSTLSLSHHCFNSGLSCLSDNETVSALTGLLASTLPHRIHSSHNMPTGNTNLVMLVPPMVPISPGWHPKCSGSLCLAIRVPSHYSPQLRITMLLLMYFFRAYIILCSLLSSGLCFMSVPWSKLPCPLPAHLLLADSSCPWTQLR